jgi:transposase
MIPPTVRIFVCTEPVDMRRGFDGLALLAKEALGLDPLAGDSLIVFSNRRRDRLKALWWDRTGYCVLYKRAHRVVFTLPTGEDSNSASVRIDGKILGTLLAGTPKMRRARPKLHVVR